MAELQESALGPMQEIYRDTQGKTMIYFSTLTLDNQKLDVAVKVINSQGMIEPYIYIEESRNQLLIQSPNVCKIYGWILKPQKVMIVMERLGSDLSKEITMRRNANYYYTELELFQIMWDLVAVFADLQRLNVSHNDIKAENVFVQKREYGRVEYKVGDFGSAAKVNRWEHALTGTPLYLSPILKAEYNRYMNTRERREFVYDTYKSDVYSLGVTFIYLAELQCPNNLQDFQFLRQNIQCHITNIQTMYPQMAFILSKMMELDEAKRWHFLDLEENLKLVSELKQHIVERTSAQKQDDAPDPHSRIIPELTPQADTLLEELNFLYEKASWNQLGDRLNAVIQVVPQLDLVCTCFQCRNCLSSIRETDSICTVCKLPPK